ncbi:MAG: single-stranded-DNA-specific exonuclease RecJ, partial [Pseudomonadota bacterium]|nr:single-stranded-DNA-specific exonuclease RecJ [Pseudomonadota bacterium]
MTSEPVRETLLGVEQSAAGRRWVMRPYDERLALTIAQRHGLPDAVSRILSQRGITPEIVADYLNPNLADVLPDPFVLIDLEKAASRLADAIIHDEKIAVFGDYDVDGATSAACLIRFMRQLGITPMLYVPNRMTEGYGPTVPAFKSLIDDGVGVIVTVDCGTMAHEALTFAKEHSVDVIVADHHQTGTSLPDCFALVNPRRGDDLSGLGNLAAVGVTFMLLVGLRRELRNRGYFSLKEEPNLMALTDLVALGTVCDVVPLEGLNRALVSQGLRVMARRENTGIKAMIDLCKLESAPEASDCGFKLGPRINAGGRVGESDLGTRLLISDNPDEAAGLALRMDELNTHRRSLGDENLSLAEKMIEDIISHRNGLPPYILLSHREFHAGVIGIVAGRLKDKYNRPTFVIALEADGTGKGSARSIKTVDIGRLVSGAVLAEVLIAGGGHAMAAGVTTHIDQLADFENYLSKELGEMSFSGPREMMFDCAVSPSGAVRDFHNLISQIGPFGAGNPEPR